jgi:hypothetical protein
MSDMRIQYTEDMVGAGHPTKDDTLNRLALVEADADGHGLKRYLKAQAGDPATGEGECVVYAKTVAGQVELFHRAEEDGAVTQITSGGRLVIPPRPVGSWAFYTGDPNLPGYGSLGPFTANLMPYANTTRLRFQEPVLAPGQAHRLMLDLALSTSATANITLRLAYKVVPLDGSQAVNLTTALWRASYNYAAGDKIIALASDGWREYTVTTDGGSSGATSPTWPTSCTVSDGGLTWTAGSVVFKSLSLTHPVTAGANQPFRVDSASLTIPAGEITADNQQIVGFLLREVGGGHTGDLCLIDGHLKAVEVQP